MMNTVAGFFLSLAADAILRVIGVEQSGTSFDHHSVGITIDVGWQSELSRENHTPPAGVIEENHGTIAAIIGFAMLNEFLAFFAFYFERVLVKLVPVSGENFLADDFY